MVVFIDDILICLKTDEEHANPLSLVLGIWKENKLYAKLSKCEFWLKEASFLDHVISSGGNVVDPLKVDAVLQWETPKPVEIQSFLGLSGFIAVLLKVFQI